jgi:preprotein translocase subunit SecF
MTEQHKFRYLLPPGNNFAFVSKFKAWVIGSVILMAIAIGSLFVNKAVRGQYMNWTIDFKGGTEIYYAFKAKGGTDHVKLDPGKVRDALASSGEEGFDVSEISWTDTNDGKVVDGMIVRTPRFSALKPEVAEQAKTEFEKKFADREIGRANWSGDRLFVRSRKLVTIPEAAPVFDAVGLELKPWAPDEAERYSAPDEGTGEYNVQYAVWGIDRQIEQALESKLEGTDVIVAQSYGVGAKAGDKLRDDATKSIIYALFLIMLYLAFRFDIRYAPGAAFATIHDAVMVIGVFSVTWTDVSLVSVAGLLTVIGFSVNDTVIVFDRIRENQAKLKDKKIERIVDISINEMLVRSVLTSVTVFATTLIMNIFGTGVVKEFAFAMNVGVVVGAYSSIFLAAPVFMWISKRFYSGPAPARRRAPVSSLPPPESSASTAQTDE